MMEDLQEIKNICIRIWGFEFNNTTRQKKYVFQRASFYFAAIKYTDDSLGTIGEFCDRDHATVIHAKKSISTKEKQLDFNARLRAIMRECDVYFKKDMKYLKDPKDRLISYQHHKIGILEKKNAVLSKIAFNDRKNKYDTILAQFTPEQLDGLYLYRIIPYAKMNGVKLINEAD